MSTKEINVCFSCDSNYAKYAGVAIASVLKNAKPDVCINLYILDGGISDEIKEQMKSLANIKACSFNFISVDAEMFKEYKDIKTHNHITIPAYYRLKMASLLPKVDKIIYFDCDFVICTDLEELYNTDMEGKPIAGVLDIDRRKVRKNPTYINTGLIVFDLAKIREEKIEEEFAQCAIQNADNIKIGDQDILNRVLKGRIKILDDEWNVQSSNFITRSSYSKHPKAIHMLAKPWKYASACYHKREYFKYLQLTPWALSKSDYKHWTEDNQIASIFAYMKRRPWFLLNPRFYYAIYKTYLERN